MNFAQLRNAVRALNVMRARGVPAHPEPVYGRDERGHTESIGDRTEVRESSHPVATDRVVIARYRFDRSAHSFTEVEVDRDQQAST